MSLENEIDLAALARRVVARLRPPSDLRDDLIQQAVALSIDLLRRFTPRDGADVPPPREQAERYLFVSLQWSLRRYARGLRSSMPAPESDGRLSRAYARLVATQGSLAIDEAARQLGIQPKRLAAALAASDWTVSLDRPGRPEDDGGDASLVDQVAASGPGPEELSVAAVEFGQAAILQAIAGAAIAGETDTSTKNRRRQTRRVLYLLLEQLRHGDSEVIRLAYALPRKELGTLRSCRTYGCRQDSGHEHTSEEIARWLQGDRAMLARRLQDSLDQLCELLGGRDPRRLLRDVSGSEGTEC